MAKYPTKPGLWWVAFDDGDKVTEVVLLEVSYYQGLSDFSEGATFRVLDGSRRDGTTYGDFRRPLAKPSWTVVLGSLTRSTVDEVQITWLREQRQPKLSVSVGSEVPA